MNRLTSNLARFGLQPWLGHHLQQTAGVCSVCQSLILQAQLRQLQKFPRIHQQLELAGQRHLLQLIQRLRSTDEVQNAISNEEPFDILADWHYSGRHGVHRWYEFFPECNGQAQSPINVRERRTEKDKNLTPFVFTNFDTTKDIAWSLENNGHTAVVSYTSGDLRVNEGDLPSDYSVAQFHFHWGDIDYRGSEHRINGVRFPLEMHIVTFKSAYANLSSALEHSDGLAVLGILFEVDEKDNNDLSHLLYGLNFIQKQGTSYPLTPVPLETFLPGNTKRYYRYHGSLTTPPCNEVVTWTLFKDTVPISSAQLSRFRTLQFKKKGSKRIRALVNNFRPVQPLNGRIVRSTIF